MERETLCGEKRCERVGLVCRGHVDGYRAQEKRKRLRSRMMRWICGLRQEEKWLPKKRKREVFSTLESDSLH
ncbi:hypothetical protein llap_4185 [Limosa lapponica baueri]|uniref:Uncharacterized protein n=1 Tax=Limosa lapponica baueri TaxID=1758121 RepID=A0A2I0UHJ2_LIMLA|nr:hypothetical protein llap_4185 [Limosa lapponica baueri]